MTDRMQHSAKRSNLSLMLSQFRWRCSATGSLPVSSGRRKVDGRIIKHHLISRCHELSRTLFLPVVSCISIWLARSLLHFIMHQYLAYSFSASFYSVIILHECRRRQENQDSPGDSSSPKQSSSWKRLVLITRRSMPSSMDTRATP